MNLPPISSVSIRAEVTTQADYVISILEQVKLFVKTKVRKYVTGAPALNYDAVLECHWNTRLKWLHCRGLSSSGIRVKH